MHPMDSSTLNALQHEMHEQRIDAWLIYDFRGNNSVLAQLLPGKRWTTRRAFLLLPAAGQPVVLSQSIDAHNFSSAPCPVETYLGWTDLHDWLARRLAGLRRVAMEYSPGNALPVVSIADAGMVELVRALGAEVVSSADLIQTGVARWSPAACETHAVASRKVADIKDDAFRFIAQALAAGQSIHEHDVQRRIQQRFAADGLQFPDGPIVAVNANAGNPHYEPSAERPVAIRRGDWVLIDLWARAPGDENIYSDITWVGFAGPRVPDAHQNVFDVVKNARDAALHRARQAWSAREPVQGWQLDDAARTVIVAAGFERAIRHRTGHSLSPGPLVHGLGMNLDNLETRDTRRMLPGIGFTIEPGVYLDDFGVRSEINVYVDPQRGPVVTSCVQDRVVIIG